MSSSVDLVLAAGALNGECPVWHPGLRRLVWVDLRGARLHVFDPETRRDEAWDMPSWIGCFGLMEKSAVVALRTGLFRFDFDTGALSFVAPPPYDPRRFLFNDGGCDPRGRFLVGPMHAPMPPDSDSGPQEAPLWRYDGEAGWTPVTPPVRVSNGLAFSPDGRRMYQSDTTRKVIWIYDYDLERGMPFNRRVFAEVEVPNPQGGPDGAAVDADGFYWSALFANGCLLRFDPDGHLERRVALPVDYPTMPAFGGADRKTLFITTANWPLSPGERAAKPFEGGLLAMEAPTAGLPSRFYDASR
jgi:sugar lactone lactonase YvrE